MNTVWRNSLRDGNCFSNRSIHYLRRSAADVPNFLRRPFGPGWALVGDAGCHKDPIKAHGICDALRDADFLTSAIHEGLAGQCPLDDALMRYERRRNEATMAEYRENIAAARFTPISPELLQLRLALRGNQEDTNRFVMALEGWISHEEFFDPENLKRIFAKAGASSRLPNQSRNEKCVDQLQKESNPVRF
jgi:2-polyprenyl-6-methoxyphenol hydroxylase-like FAD-dependent oxidoreductase